MANDFDERHQFKSVQIRQNLGEDSEKEFPTYAADDISRLADITCSQAPLLMLHLRNVNRISVARSSISAAWMKTWEFKQGTLTAQIVEESPAEWRTGAGFAWETFRTWYRKHNFQKMQTMLGSSRACNGM